MFESRRIWGLGVVVGGLVGVAGAQQSPTVRGTWKLSDTQGGRVPQLRNDDQLGRSVTVIGDLDGNGTLDLASGGVGDDDGGIDQGAVHVLFLRPDGRVVRGQKISELAGGFTGVLDPGDQFGRSVAGIGDLDGDGLPDLAVGANYDDDGGINKGAVWLLRLNADGTVKYSTKISSTQGGFAGPLRPNDEFGRSVASLGDLDGDGNIDIAVGAPLDQTGGTKRGAVYILFLNADGSVKRHTKIASGMGGFLGRLRNTDWFGFSLANLGDFDGDGVTDLAVGAALDDDGAVNAGAVWLLYLRPDGRVKGHSKISMRYGGFTGALEYPDQFGTSVARIGDLNGDGITELAVGAVKDGDGGAERGSVYVLFMKPDGSVAFHRKISAKEGGLPRTMLGNWDWFGSSLAPLGDFNGDGVPDVAVGARNDDDGGSNRGAVYLTYLNRVPTAFSAADIAAGPGETVLDLREHGPGEGEEDEEVVTRALPSIADSTAFGAGPEPVGDLALVEGDGTPGSRLTFRLAVPPELAGRGGLARLLVASRLAADPMRAERTGFLLEPSALLGSFEAVAAPAHDEVEITLRLPPELALESLSVQGLWTQDETRKLTDALEVRLLR